MRDIRRFYINGKNPYKSPTKLIDSQHSDIAAAAEYLVKEAKNTTEKIAQVLDFIQNEISFALTAKTYSWPASKVLYHKKGDFSQRLILACAMLRALDIGCRIYFYEANHPLFERLAIKPSVALSGFLEVYDQKEWVATDHFLLPYTLTNDLLKGTVDYQVYTGKSDLIWCTPTNDKVRNFGILSDVLETKAALTLEILQANQPGWWSRRQLNQDYQRYLETLKQS